MCFVFLHFSFIRIKHTRYNVLISDFVSLDRASTAVYPSFQSLCCAKTCYSYACTQWYSSYLLILFKKVNEWICKNFFRRFFLYHNLSRNLCLRTCRAEQFFMSCSLKKPAGFSVECLHMLTCFTHDSCRPQTKQELFSAVRPTCCFCLWALGFACVRTNSFNIKTFPLFQIPTPLFTRATFYNYPMP